MSNQSLAPLATVQRLFAEGRILAGFLTEDVARTLPDFIRAPVSNQTLVREKFGLAGARSGDSVPHPVFRHVEEEEANNILLGAAPRCGGPVTLSNLVGFEWVEIAGIIAGHYVAAPMPVEGRFPTTTAAVSEIARYCILGNQASSQDLLVLASGNVVSSEKLNLRLSRLDFGPQSLAVTYALELEPSPIALLLVENRVIAVRHQERLVALVEAGVKEALCLVHYGYGTEILRCLPTIDPTLLTSKRPPLIVDFTKEETMTRIPVQVPRTLLTFSQQTIDLAT